MLLVDNNYVGNDDIKPKDPKSLSFSFLMQTKDQ